MPVKKSIPTINIHGKEKYFIDKEGNIYTMLKGATTKVGYKVVSLGGRGGKKAYIHDLVLETFIGKRPEGKEACHINGEKSDNRLDNLYWGTRKENVADAIKLGTKRGYFQWKKLTEIIYG
jgi:hypothetical protein